VIADAGYDSDEIRRSIRRMKKQAVICATPNRKKKPRLDKEAYRKRYLVEVFFHELKRFRGLAMRFAKTAKHYLAELHVACAFLWAQDLTGPEPVSATQR
jgi:transposase